MRFDTEAQFYRFLDGARPAVTARGRPVRRHPGRMNGVEREFSLQLEARKRAGEIAEWWFESFTFKLAPDLRYTPDFAVLVTGTNEIEFFETKAEWSNGRVARDDAIVKIKMAAQLFPFKFNLCVKRSKKSGGGWDVREV